MNLASIRNETNKFITEYEREHYQDVGGFTDNPKTEEIFDRHKSLFDPSTILYLKKLNEGKGDKRLRYLIGYLLPKSLDKNVAEIDDEIGRVESTTKVVVGSQQIPYRSSYTVMMNEEDRNKRNEIFQAANDAVKNNMLNLMKEKWDALHQKAKDFGYTSYASMFQELKGVNFDELRDKIVMPILQETEKEYEIALAEALESKVGIELEDAYPHDIRRLTRGTEYDKYFPKGRAIQVTKATLKNLGINLDASNVILDIEYRENKNPRAECLPIRVPEEIVLLTKPIGGVLDQRNTNHEAGHTSNYIHVPKNRPLEFRHWPFGDKGVDETYSALFENLVLSPSWLSEYVTKDDMTEFIKQQWLNESIWFRRIASDFIFETEFHKGNLKNPEKFNKVVKEKNLKYKLRGSEIFYPYIDPEFYGTNYLRSYVLEAMLRRHLAESFGKEWFLKKEAGDSLKRLWRYGKELTGKELAMKIGFSDLNPVPYIEDLKRELM
jgi:hypothetical protein